MSIAWRRRPLDDDCFFLRPQPATEEILNSYLRKFRGDEILNGSQNFAYVKPAKAGSRTKACHVWDVSQTDGERWPKHILTWS